MEQKQKQQPDFAAPTPTEKRRAYLLMIMEKIKTYLPYATLAVALVTAFFVHESIASKNPEIELASSQWQQAKLKRTEALNAVKKLTLNSTEYNLYLIEKQKTDALFIRLNALTEENKFMGFPNFQYFLGEFGWAFGLFLIGIYLTVRDCVRNTKLLPAEMLINGTVITIALFFMSWATNGTEGFTDFDKSTYIVFNILLSIITCIGTYIIVKYKLSVINFLKSNISKLITLNEKNTTLIESPDKEKQAFINSMEVYTDLID